MIDNELDPANALQALKTVQSHARTYVLAEFDGWRVEYNYDDTIVVTSVGNLSSEQGQIVISGPIRFIGLTKLINTVIHTADIEYRKWNKERS